MSRPWTCIRPGCWLCGCSISLCRLRFRWRLRWISCCAMCLATGNWLGCGGPSLIGSTNRSCLYLVYCRSAIHLRSKYLWQCLFLRLIHLSNRPATFLNKSVHPDKSNCHGLISFLRPNLPHTFHPHDKYRLHIHDRYRWASRPCRYRLTQSKRCRYRALNHRGFAHSIGYCLKTKWSLHHVTCLEIAWRIGFWRRFRPGGIAGWDIGFSCGFRVQIDWDIFVMPLSCFTFWEKVDSYGGACVEIKLWLSKCGYSDLYQISF